MRSDIFISASAGTGKTYNLVKNYIEVFEEAFRRGETLDVHNVVAITFTNKAAKEMKDRVISWIDDRIALDIPANGRLSETGSPTPGSPRYTPSARDFSARAPSFWESIRASRY
jgi:ATP-dependent exoDNAse (exonuclease V) beta subunit